ncbi:MAG: MBL fold metallo-hydrolase [Prevotella sp.]|uniref:MBL fold metallo-hydrolase n=1 Tax=Prevotella sp. TaxID=59823 RepID=UPI002A3455C0|nr:MBL fold metallo-hydrolase [Prevotella sp.]MDD7318224.1 MBL fold metallo-hydrolase [Prevotellaceae bacterium]MDY4020887.1 MBL fold metallo-hydrolase [Prevotella sp.]
MLNIKRFVFNPLQENTYVVSDGTGECAIIDCGAFNEKEYEEIAEYIAANDLQPQKLICTHGHFDHCAGNEFIKKQYGIKAEVSLKDKFLTDSLSQQAMLFLGIKHENDLSVVGSYFTGRDNISFGSHTFSILETPGHTPGSVTFYCEEEGVAFTGDTLFQMSIGRTDFEGGSITDMMNSLKNVLAKLPKDTIVLSGHGGRTTIGDELKTNPYLR